MINGLRNALSLFYIVFKFLIIIRFLRHIIKVYCLYRCIFVKSRNHTVSRLCKIQSPFQGILPYPDGFLRPGGRYAHHKAFRIKVIPRIFQVADSLIQGLSLSHRIPGYTHQGNPRIGNILLDLRQIPSKQGHCIPGNKSLIRCDQCTSDSGKTLSPQFISHIASQDHTLVRNFRPPGITYRQFPASLHIQEHLKFFYRLIKQSHNDYKCLSLSILS